MQHGECIPDGLQIKTEHWKHQNDITGEDACKTKCSSIINCEGYEFKIRKNGDKKCKLWFVKV